MDEIEYQAVIKYLFLKGKTPTQIKDELDSVYGDSAPSFTTVKFWAAEFKRKSESKDSPERERNESSSSKQKQKNKADK